MFLALRCSMFAHRHTFIALLDPDEYIVLKEPPQPPRIRPHLPTFLAPFEAYGGISVHWQLFGPSGHVVRPNGSTLASYTQCVPRHVLQVGIDPHIWRVLLCPTEEGSARLGIKALVSRLKAAPVGGCAK